MVVYPRWRGELDRTASVVSSGSGLSPLARGTHRPRTTIRANRRFIPAGAGNTALSFSYYRPATVYPRWRGEHYRTDCRILFFCGLSPLARGTRCCDYCIWRGPGFIPAGAGNTLVLNRPALETPVYPRWRGEHIYQNISFYSHGGLSPLARGTRIKHGLTRRAARFIPAGAGNTRLQHWIWKRGAVYPRWRGEHAAIIQKRTQGIGLSPLARGTRLNMYIYSLPYPVYPRWRGEHDRPRHLAVADQGLSPLARGTQRLFPAQTLRIRFIPAGAGNTAAKS